MIITSNDIWSDMEKKLTTLCNEKAFEERLLVKVETFINHYKSASANNTQYTTLNNLLTIEHILFSSNYRDLYIKEKHINTILDLTNDFKLLENALFREGKNIVKEEIKIKDRLPNEGNDKSLKIFEDVREVTLWD